MNVSTVTKFVHSTNYLPEAVLSMTRAMWHGVVLAESDKTILVDGYHYFPRDSVRWEYLKPSAHTTVCGWKGKASYYDVEVGGAYNQRAAWCYPDPKPAAEEIRGQLGSWRGVEVVSGGDDALAAKTSSR